MILLPTLTGMEDQGTLMDVAVHMGTLVAVLAYFFKDTKGLTLATLGAVGITPARRAVEGSEYPRMLWLLILATIPVIIAGFILSSTGAIQHLRSATVIATTSIVFGVLLYWADTKFPHDRDLSDLKLRGALIIGLSQILALIPGTSRSGITMTAARGLGFKRTDAARFSMLLSIPTITGAGTLAVKDMIDAGDAVLWGDALIAGGLSCIAALAAIHFLMRWLATASMTIFVVYRVGLGLLLFGLIGAGVI
ncbi:undecaprenyl-diphosphatase [Kordiimonas sediminis]|uniref:Undecaprenyl-diphosphatase n=1 Tax=Kordiimonas sediminis TaxID=1735581 RepID=A0A919ANJ5_9PROT|nr:undecaprenyl-diphosphatase [Kordiimonas sediminis]